MKVDTKKALLFFIILLLSPIASGQIDLPELGDSASQRLRPAQQKELGLVFFQKILNSKDYVSDLLLNNYLQSLGNRIFQNTDIKERKLTLSLLKQSRINAFASPGGYITLNTGLILATRSESEVASVISHEIAHLTQNHIARLFSRAQENKIPAMAAILASILVGGDTGLAGLTTTQAALASDQLRYSRHFEQEADALGIDLLAKSEFNPNAMSSFFTQLEKQNRHSIRPPEFLLTHPMSLRRKAEADNRASRYTTNQISYPSSLEYDFAKARIRVLSERSNQDLMRFFRDQLTIKKDLPTAAAQYGMVLVDTKRKEFVKATALLQKLLQTYPNNRWLLQAQGEILMGQKHYQKAVEWYLPLTKKFNQDLYFSLFLTDAYLANKQPEKAKQLLRRLIRHHPDNYLLYQKLSKAYLALDDTVLAIQADIEYYAILGDYKQAIARADSALAAIDDKNSYLANSIRARKIKMQQKEKAQKRALRI